MRPTVSGLVRYRRALGVVATLVCAGVGHLLVGRWRRGLAWLALYTASLAFLSRYAIADGMSAEPFLVRVLEAPPSPADVIFPLSILALCLIDLYAVTGSAAPVEPRTSRTGQ